MEFKCCGVIMARSSGRVSVSEEHTSYGAYQCNVCRKRKFLKVVKSEKEVSLDEFRKNEAAYQKLRRRQEM